MKLTDNFSLIEFKSKDGADFPADVLSNIIRLADALQIIRNELGKPISITSGYRSPEHNLKVKGAVNSKHIQGLAADFKVSGMIPNEVFLIVDRLINEGKIPQGGLKAYKTWVHYDIAGKKRRW
jgi:uncharacterized protein YcbK (DUF882 family)